jgi:EAL domain-containing protein (putative c-di-GMP-specific phosphodiesterase class I)
VVAEGVETDGEAAALRALGVDYGQGWHYGRPGPPEALSAIADPLIPAQRAPQPA